MKLRHGNVPGVVTALLFIALVAACGMIVVASASPMLPVPNSLWVIKMPEEQLTLDDVLYMEENDEAIQADDAQSSNNDEQE